MSVCIFQAIAEIEENGGDSARVVLAMTDGTWGGTITNRVSSCMCTLFV